MGLAHVSTGQIMYENVMGKVSEKNYASAGSGSGSDLKIEA